MKKALKRIQASELYYYKDGEKIVIEKKYYDKLEIDLGDGVVNYIRGDVSSINGDVSSISGDVDECAITEEERQKGIDIIDLVE